jgi:AcrR family transcriptional regulator
MSQTDAERILSAARRLRTHHGGGFSLTELARPAGLSRATLYRRLTADPNLAAEIERLRKEGSRNPREEFLRAATTLLTEGGISALTMEAVAARAGLSTATLYRTFADRDTLLRETFKTVLPAEPLRQLLVADGPMVLVLERFVDGLIHRMRERPYLLRFLLLRTPDDIQELRKLRRDEERMSTGLVAFFERHSAEFRPLSPRQLAASLMGQVLGSLLFQKSHEGFQLPEAKMIVDSFLHGMKRSNHGGTAT